MALTKKRKSVAGLVKKDVAYTMKQASELIKKVNT
ncbi:MAG: hypothetical protein RL708_252, partial [Bacteroidota bacterium]